jgi:hypothetical protein
MSIRQLWTGQIGRILQQNQRSAARFAITLEPDGCPSGFRLGVIYNDAFDDCRGAARHLSYVAAANELDVTSAAVGNLVRGLEAAQRRLDQNPQAMRVRRETLEHPFGTMKARMGATHFLTKTLPKVVTEMALSALAYNLTAVMNIVGTRALIAAIEA